MNAARSAQTKVARAIKVGTLVRQPCEVCGMAPGFDDSGPWAGHEVVIAHHDDYSRPLDVRWLCRQHHADHHRTQGSYLNNGRNAA